MTETKHGWVRGDGLPEKPATWIYTGEEREYSNVGFWEKLHLSLEPRNLLDSGRVMVRSLCLAGVAGAVIGGNPNLGFASVGVLGLEAVLENTIGFIKFLDEDFVG